jgi:hypothetical protein
MNTEEVVSLAVYVVALVALTFVLHRRYRCVRASLAAGFLAALLATSVFAVFGPNRYSPAEYIASFVWFGVTPAIVGAALSAMMGAFIQIRKNENGT